MGPQHALDREFPRPRSEYVTAIHAVSAFRVDVAQEREAVRVSPVGELDLATVGRVSARIDEAIASGTKRVILDLREVSFLDSAGLHLAIDTVGLARRSGTGFSIVAGPPAVQRAFAITGLRSRLPFVDAPHG
jgi:anti-sigma B factor antagonist